MNVRFTLAVVLYGARLASLLIGSRFNRSTIGIGIGTPIASMVHL
jgi:hypothetical protein